MLEEGAMRGWCGSSAEVYAVTRLWAFGFSELAETSATLAKLGEARSETSRGAYFRIVRDAIVAAGGRELVADDDGVLAVFDSASDALAFAGMVQRGCERRNRRPSERLDVRLGVEVGETSLEAGVGVGTAGAVARARELARAASSGGVLASGLVAALAASTDARFVPVGLLELPGLAEPVSAFAVEWQRRAIAPTPLPAELERGGIGTPFVGRGPERERLRVAWRASQGGERQFAFVAGEPGVGKTRLVAEFARGLHEEGASVLWGRSSEEALSPYEPFVRALRHHVRSTAPEELREQVGAGAGVLARLLPELVPRLTAPPLPVEDGEGERFRLFEAVGQFVTAISAERPVLLVLDDLQWADHGTLLLLKHLARDPSPAELLIVGTYRDSEVGPGHPLALVRADVERDRIVEQVELAGLQEDEVAALLGVLTGWEPPAEVVRSLRAETEGNPFFLEEVVRHLAQLGLSADPMRLADVRGTVQELGVPSRVRELVGRRVHRLSQATSAALAAASVVGSEFERDLLAEVLTPESDQALADALDEAVRGRLLDEVESAVGRYRFSHALIQQALYEEQTLNRRAALHEQVAAAIERLRPDTDESLAELARHYGRAGDRHAAKVVRYARAAGERALALLAYEDAVREFSTALSAQDRVGADDSAARAELLTLLGTAELRAGETSAARSAFVEAAELSAPAGAWQTLAAAALGYGGAMHFGGVWETFPGVDAQLVRLLELALAACPTQDSRERARLLGRLSQALYWSPDTKRALELSDAAVTMARRLGDTAALAHALDSRNVVLWRPDHLDERQTLAEEMLRLGRDLGDHDIQLEAHCWLITGALERGALSLVDELIGEHARLAYELRQPYHLWFNQALRVMRAHLDGRLQEADELCERAYSYGLHVHEANAFQVHSIQRVFLSLDQGRAGELIPDLESEAVPTSAPVWRAAAALALAGVDRPEETLAQVAALAEQGFGSIARDCLWMPTLVALGRSVAHFDDPTYAADLYALLLPFADRTCVAGGPVLCLGPVSRILGMLARAEGRPDDALDHFVDALEGSRALGSPTLVARTQLETAKARLLRQAPGDAAVAERLLGEAAAIAEALGMAKLEHDVEAVRGSLPGGVVA